MSPLSEDAKKLYRNTPALFFTAQAQADVEQRQVKQLGGLLGVYWTQEDVQALFAAPQQGKKREPLQRLMIPFLLGMQPNLQDYLKKQFGSALGIHPPKWYAEDPGDVVEGIEMGWEDFVEMAHLFTPFIPAKVPTLNGR